MNSDSPLEETLVQTDTSLICKNCANKFTGKYCNLCGEKVISQHDRTVMHFLKEVFHIITHADNKLVKNLKLMASQPGMLSRHYAEGLRQRFMKPVAMFFVGNLIYFLFPFFSTFTTSLYYQANHQRYSDWIKPQIEKKMEQRKMTFDELSKIYNEKTVSYSKLLLIALVPMYAVVYFILNFRKRKLFADHLVAGFEFMSFTLFYNTIILSLVLLIFYLIFKLFGVDLNPIFRNEWALLMPITLASVFYFAFYMQRNFFSDKVVPAIIKAVVFVFMSLSVITVYRFLLFEVTLFKI